MKERATSLCTTTGSSRSKHDKRNKNRTMENWSFTIGSFVRAKQASRVPACMHMSGQTQQHICMIFACLQACTLLLVLLSPRVRAAGFYLK
jgi:hypothetical protein